MHAQLAVHMHKANGNLALGRKVSYVPVIMSVLSPCNQILHYIIIIMYITSSLLVVVYHFIVV